MPRTLKRRRGGAVLAPLPETLRGHAAAEADVPESRGDVQEGPSASSPSIAPHRGLNFYQIFSQVQRQKGKV